MRVLVATDKTQGAVDGDYCGRSKANSFSVGRCWSARRRTDAARARLPGSGQLSSDDDGDGRRSARHRPQRTGQAIRDSLDRQGWLQEMEPDEIEHGVEDEIALIEEVTSAFPTGAIVGRHGTEVVMRAWLFA